MTDATISAAGEVTLGEAVLEHLGVRPGQKVRVAPLPNGRVQLSASDRPLDISSVAGILHRPGQRPITLEEMQEAIEAGAAASCFGK